MLRLQVDPFVCLLGPLRPEPCGQWRWPRSLGSVRSEPGQVLARKAIVMVDQVS